MEFTFNGVNSKDFNIKIKKSNHLSIPKKKIEFIEVQGRTDNLVIDEGGVTPLYKAIGLVGPNGTGKSTLMKLIDGELKETSGFIQRDRQLRVGRFHQHHVDVLPMEMSSIEYMQQVFPTAQVQEIRQFLGRFGLKGDTPKQKIVTLSGGQKSRLVFAEICWKKPHLLLLDEPTNHLDADSIESLIEGLAEFGGGLLLISHHQHMIEEACNEIWICKGNGTIERFDGDFYEYKKMLLNEMDLDDDDEEEE